MSHKIEPMFRVSDYETQNFPNKKRSTKQIEDNFLPVYASFWFLGIGCFKNASFQQKLLSVVMIIMVDGPSVYDIIINLFFLEHVDSSSSKSAYTAALMHICSIVLRIWLYKERWQMQVIVRKVVKAYHLTSTKKLLFRRKIVFIFILNELYVIMNFCFFTYGAISGKDYEDIVAKYFFNKIPTSVATKLYFIIQGIVEFCLHNIPALLSIYFFFLAQVLKAAFNEYADMILQHKNQDFRHLLMVHNKITDSLSVANSYLHIPLLLSFTYTLSSAFYSMFEFLFTMVSNSYEDCDHILSFFWSLFYFSLFCFSSSMVNNAATRIKDLVHKLPGDDKDAKRMSLILKIHSHFTGFTVLESIDIDKSLILAAVGTMFTYGIMFATFNVTTKNTDV